MTEKLILLFMIPTLISCTPVKKIGNPIKKCPPQDERTILNILCQEKK